ncbi:hypothetical protein [Methanocella paludicola]|nr:hypothetical protein [Methanocella paludicola]
MLNYLKKEFCWFLELNKSKYRLVINGEGLNYSDILVDKQQFEIKHELSSTVFNIQYIRWNYQLNLEYSKFYYLDNNGNEIYKENTKFNNKGDNFYHSVFISSDYFLNFNFDNGDIHQKSLGVHSIADEEFKLLQNELSKYLRRQRKPLIIEQAESFVTSLDKDIIDKSNKSDFELLQIEHLEAIVKEVYVTEPKIFKNLKYEQKKTFIGLLNVLLISDERDEILDIIDEVVKLDSKERTQLKEILQHASLSNIVKTIKLIKDRLQALELLSQVVFNHDLYADEVNHLQEIVQNHYWIFGEQYNLVAAAEDNFEKALKEHIHILTEKDQEDYEGVPLDHPDKLKQVDIFICRQEKNNGHVKNIIVELKHPNIRLGRNQLYQVRDYMRIIREIDRFNADNYKWEYILVGNKYNTSHFIEDELTNNEKLGEPGLVYKVDNVKIYVKKWSDVLNECDLRFKFLNDRLEIEKSKLVAELKTAEQAVELSRNSAAISAD